MSNRNSQADLMIDDTGRLFVKIFLIFYSSAHILVPKALPYLDSQVLQ